MSIAGLILIDKNHNPRKGTETFRIPGMAKVNLHDKNHNPRKGTETRQSAGLRPRPSDPIRTIIPARGRKLAKDEKGTVYVLSDKNHNPRKGTETETSLVANYKRKS